MGPSLRSNNENIPHTHAGGAHAIRHHGSAARNGLHYGGAAERQTSKALDWSDADPMLDDYSPVHSTDGRTSGMSHERPYGAGQVHNSQRPQYPRLCRRTITFAGVPDNASLKDITDVVRGGMLLDVFLRTTDHVAIVSFLHEEDAVRFYEHARKHDIYIKNKRVCCPEIFVAHTD